MFNLRRSQFVQVFFFLTSYYPSFCLISWTSLYLQWFPSLSIILPWQVFNNSPDETAYFRMLLYRENITNAAVMIQPSLISYSFNSLPAPALLDVASIAADRILLLDSYFSVVIFHGMTIAQWRNMGYQNQAEHQVWAHFNHVLPLFLSSNNGHTLDSISAIYSWRNLPWAHLSIGSAGPWKDLYVGKPAAQANWMSKDIRRWQNIDKFLRYFGNGAYWRLYGTHISWII